MILQIRAPFKNYLQNKPDCDPTFYSELMQEIWTLPPQLQMSRLVCSVLILNSAKLQCQTLKGLKSLGQDVLFFTHYNTGYIAREEKEYFSTF